VNISFQTIFTNSFTPPSNSQHHLLPNFSSFSILSVCFCIHLVHPVHPPLPLIPPHIPYLPKSPSTLSFNHWTPLYCWNVKLAEPEHVCVGQDGGCLTTTKWRRSMKMTFAQMRRTCCSTNNAKHLLPSHKTARQVQVKGPLRISLTQKLSFFDIVSASWWILYRYCISEIIVDYYPPPQSGRGI